MRDPRCERRFAVHKRNMQTWKLPGPGTCTQRNTRGTVGGTNIIHPSRRPVDRNAGRPAVSRDGADATAPAPALTRPRNHRARQQRRSEHAQRKHPRPAKSLRNRAISCVEAHLDCRCPHVRALNEFGICKRSSSASPTGRAHHTTSEIGLYNWKLI